MDQWIRFDESNEVEREDANPVRSISDGSFELKYILPTGLKTQKESKTPLSHFF